MLKYTSHKFEDWVANFLSLLSGFLAFLFCNVGKSLLDLEVKIVSLLKPHSGHSDMMASLLELLFLHLGLSVVPEVSLHLLDALDQFLHLLIILDIHIVTKRLLMAVLFTQLNLVWLEIFCKFSFQISIFDRQKWILALQVQQCILMLLKLNLSLVILPHFVLLSRWIQSVQERSVELQILRNACLNLR